MGDPEGENLFPLLKIWRFPVEHLADYVQRDFVNVHDKYGDLKPSYMHMQVSASYTSGPD